MPKKKICREFPALDFLVMQTFVLKNIIRGKFTSLWLCAHDNKDAHVKDIMRMGNKTAYFSIMHIEAHEVFLSWKKGTVKLFSKLLQEKWIFYSFNIPKLFIRQCIVRTIRHHRTCSGLAIIKNQGLQQWQASIQTYSQVQPIYTMLRYKSGSQEIS